MALHGITGIYFHLWTLERALEYKLHYLPEKGFLPSLEDRDCESPLLQGAWCSLWVCTGQEPSGTNLPEWMEP